MLTLPDAPSPIITSLIRFRSAEAGTNNDVIRKERTRYSPDSRRETTKILRTAAEMFECKL